MAKGVWSPRWQKWLSLCGLMINIFLPCLLVSVLFSVPVAYGVSCQLAFFIVNSLFFLKKFPYPSEEYQQDQQMTLNEPSIVNTFNQYASLAQVSCVKLLVDNTKLPRCESLGWPYANSVSVSKGMLTLLQKGFPKKTLAAIFAHELTHLKNGDSAARLVSLLFKSAIELESQIFLASGLILATYLGVSFFLSISISSLLTLALPLFCMILALQVLTQANQFLYQQHNHALEFLADEGAVILTKDPLSTSLMTFEIHFYSLATNNNPMATHYFKHFQGIAKSRKIPTGEVYRQTLHTEQPSTLITHPLDSTRHQVIKEAYPEAFANLPKLR